MLFLLFIFALVLGSELPIAVALQGGHGTVISQFPFLGSFYFPAMNERAHRCNTILVAWTAALTAGRCVIHESLLPEIIKLNFTNFESYIYMGDSRLGSQPQQKRRVSRADLHLQFAVDPNNIVGALFDVAVLTVLFPFTESPTVQLVPNLNALRQSDATVPDMTGSLKGILTSWGSIEAFPDSGDGNEIDEDACVWPMPADLQYIHVEIIFNMRNCCEIILGQTKKFASTEDIDTCVDQLTKAHYVNCFTPFYWNTKNTSTAWGDAGGPLVWQYKEHTWYVLGMYISGVPHHSPPFHVYFPGFFIPYDHLLVDEPFSATTVSQPNFGLLKWLILIVILLSS